MRQLLRVLSAIVLLLGIPTAAFAQTQPIYCGAFAENSVMSGAGAVPEIVELRAAGRDTVRFLWPPATARPALGSHLCVRVSPATTVATFVQFIAPGDAGYLPPPVTTLPNTSTARTDGGLLAIVAFAILVSLRLRTRGVATPHR